MDSFWLTTITVSLLATLFAMLRPRHHTGRSATARRAAVPVPHTIDQSDMGRDLGAEIREAVSDREARANELRIRFTLAIEPGLVAWTDRQALRIALLDLLNHAMGRTPSGSVLVSAGRRNGQVRIAVSDDGPFGDEPGARDALRPVSELLASLGGCLEIDSRPGEGMTVTMQLPDDAATKPEPVPLVEHPTWIAPSRA